jgi:ESX secretion-associated protein EspG
VALSRASYALTWVTEGMGDQPAGLFTLPDTATSQARTDATLRAAAELEQAGLYDRRSSRLHPDLLAAYRLLARPEVEFSGDVATVGRSEPFNATVAVGGGHAVLAVMDGDSVMLCPVPVDAAAEALVGVLPAVPPAQGQSVAVPASAVDCSGRSHVAEGGEFSVFAGQGPTDPAVSWLRRLAAEPRQGAAQLRVAVRDQRGRRWPGEFALNVLDVASGRWFIQRQRNASGHVWLTVAPASSATLATKLYEVCRALQTVR